MRQFVAQHGIDVDAPVTLEVKCLPQLCCGIWA